MIRHDVRRFARVRFGGGPGRTRGAFWRGTLALGAAWLGAVALGAVAPPTRYALADGSRFWIEGTSTLGTYTCRARRVDGEATVNASAPLAGRAELRAEVRSFACGQPQMNRDFVRALRADRQPQVVLVVERVDVGAAADGTFPVAATGTLRLAGVERAVTFRATARTLPDGRVRVEGQHVLRMTDFGVTPPSGLMGLVKAHDRVLARFDVVAAPER